MEFTERQLIFSRTGDCSHVRSGYWNDSKH